MNGGTNMKKTDIVKDQKLFNAKNRKLWRAMVIQALKRQGT